MTTEHATLDTPAPNQNKPTCRGRDGDTIQDGETGGETNKPPNHGKATNPGEMSTFLEWLHPDTPLDPDVISEKWSYWFPRSVAADRHPIDDPAARWESEPWWSE